MEESVPAEDVAPRADGRAGLLLLPASLVLRVPDDVAAVEPRVEVQGEAARRLTSEIYREPGGPTVRGR